MAKVEIVHEEPKPPAVKEVVLHLSPKEAHDLFVLVSIKDPYEVTRRVAIPTTNIKQHCECIQEALKGLDTLKDF